MMQRAKRGGVACSEEDLGVAELIIRLAYVARKGDGLCELGGRELLQEVGHVIAVAAVDVVVRDARGEGRADELYRLEGARASQLREHERRRDRLWHELQVGLEAAHEVGVRHAEVAHQPVEVVDEAAPDRIERGVALLLVRRGGSSIGREERGEQLVGRGGERGLKVRV